MNSVSLIGNITNELKIQNVGNNLPLLKFSIAVNEKVNKQDLVNYFDIVVWGKLAEVIAQYFSKGKKIALTGKLRQERWQDKKDGSNRSKVMVILNEFTFVESKSNNQTNTPNYPTEFDDLPFDDEPVDNEVPF